MIQWLCRSSGNVDQSQHTGFLMFEDAAVKRPSSGIVGHKCYLDMFLGSQKDGVSERLVWLCSTVTRDHSKFVAPASWFLRSLMVRKNRDVDRLKSPAGQEAVDMTLLLQRSLDNTAR